MPLFGPPNVDKLKAKGDIKGLIEALKYKKEMLVRATAAEALGEIGDARAMEPLIAMLTENSYYARLYVVRALGQIGDARAVEPLTATLEDEDWRVRKAAAEALGQIDDPQAVAALDALEEYRVSNFPAELLRVMGDPREIQAAYEGRSDNPHIIKAIRDMVAKREK